jgi:hypothetical protein
VATGTRVADRTDIVEFLCKYFLVEEPLNVALGLTEQNSRNLLTDITDHCLKDDVSFTVRRASDAQLVAIRLNSVEHSTKTLPKENKGNNLHLPLPPTKLQQNVQTQCPRTTHKKNARSAHSWVPSTTGRCRICPATCTRT